MTCQVQTGLIQGLKGAKKKSSLTGSRYVFEGEENKPSSLVGVVI